MAERPFYGRRLSLTHILLTSTLMLLVVFIGCADPVKSFNQAEELQHSGQYAAALQQYARLLEKVPGGEREVLALIQLRMGECLWSLNRPQEAYGVLEESIRNNPNSAASHVRMAELLLAGSDIAGAAEQANIVLQSDPNNLEALSVLGTAFIDGGQPEEAKLVLTHILAIDPTQVNSALVLAETYARENQAAAARKVLNNATTAQPRDPRPWLALARLEEIVGDGNAAESDYRQAVKVKDSSETELRLAQFLARETHIKEAEDILQRVGSDDSEARVTLPDFELAAGRTTPATMLYNRILGSPALLNPGETHSLSRSSVAARLIEAELQLAQQQKQADDPASASTLSSANAHLRQFRSYFDPATATALAAEVSLALGNVSSAEEQAQQAVAFAPGSAPAHYVLGLVRQRDGLPNLAKNEWQTALQIAPGFTPARIAIAMQALHSGEATPAEEITSSIIREEPANFQALCIYARSLSALHRFDQATLIARRALAANSASAEPHEILGGIALGQHNLGKALVEYEQALLLEPHSQSATQELAQVYQHGTISRAMLAKIEKMATNAPRSPALMEIAGRLYSQNGWRPDARRCLRRALLWDPQRASAATALAQLYIQSGQPAAANELLNNSSHPATAQTVSGNKHPAEDYEKLLQHGDPSGAAANNLAWIYAQQGTNLDRALMLAQRARLLAPQNPAVLDTLGVVHLKRHEYSQAVLVLKKAIEMAALNPVEDNTLVQFRQHLAEAYLRSGQTQAASALQQ